MDHLEQEAIKMVLISQLVKEDLAYQQEVMLGIVGLEKETHHIQEKTGIKMAIPIF